MELLEKLINQDEITAQLAFKLLDADVLRVFNRHYLYIDYKDTRTLYKQGDLGLKKVLTYNIK